MQSRLGSTSQLVLSNPRAQPAMSTGHAMRRDFCAPHLKNRCRRTTSTAASATRESGRFRRSLERFEAGCSRICTREGEWVSARTKTPKHVTPAIDGGVARFDVSTRQVIALAPVHRRSHTLRVCFELVKKWTDAPELTQPCNLDDAGPIPLLNAD